MVPTNVLQLHPYRFQVLVILLMETKIGSQLLDSPFGAPVMGKLCSFFSYFFTFLLCEHPKA